MTALFESLGDHRFQPGEHTIGPWDPGALHGGPVAALVAGELEATIGDADLGDFVPSRFSLELLRPVPADLLTVTTTLRRPGRRICVADATVTTDDGTIVVAATLEGIRRKPFAHDIADAHPRPDGPGTGRPLAARTLEGPPAYHRTGTEHRLVAGSFEAPGPASDWIRLLHPVVDGRAVTPLQRVMAAADYGNGVSGWFSFEDVLFLNPDLTVFLTRLPVGEWVCLEARTEIGPDGVGLAHSVLFDEDGPIGRAVQMLLVEPR